MSTGLSLIRDMVPESTGEFTGSLDFNLSSGLILKIATLAF